MAWSSFTSRIFFLQVALRCVSGFRKLHWNFSVTDSACGTVADILWSVLRGHQPLSTDSHLHVEHHSEVPGKTANRDAATSVLHRRQRLPQHVARCPRLVQLSRVFCLRPDKVVTHLGLKTCYRDCYLITARTWHPRC